MLIGKKQILVLSVVMLSVLAGCNPITLFTKRGVTDVSGRSDKGLVIVLTGIEGRSMLNEAICHGLEDGGVKYKIELYDWTSRFGPVANQRAEGRNRGQANQIAAIILRYKTAYPGRPVYLVGQSGGGAMAAWVAESLPRNQQVDGVVMLAASLSPQYSLETALSRSRQGIVNFYSTKDWFILGVGTTFIGTMDGEHTSSAGKTGFERPASLMRPLTYERLFQISWTPQMAQSGNTGNHLSSGTSSFVAAYVAPLILATEWNTQVMADLVKAPQTPPAPVQVQTNHAQTQTTPATSPAN
jgi:pimeloyl-ACP methyl ester carboxylesterase